MSRRKNQIKRKRRRTEARRAEQRSEDRIRASALGGDEVWADWSAFPRYQKAVGATVTVGAALTVLALAEEISPGVALPAYLLTFAAGVVFWNSIRLHGNRSWRLTCTATVATWALLFPWLF